MWRMQGGLLPASPKPPLRQVWSTGRACKHRTLCWTLGEVGKVVFKKWPYFKRKGHCLKLTPVIAALLLTPTGSELTLPPLHGPWSEIIILKCPDAPTKLILKGSMKMRSAPEIFILWNASDQDGLWTLKDWVQVCGKSLWKTKLLGVGFGSENRGLWLEGAIEVIYFNYKNKLRSREKKMSWGYTESSLILICIINELNIELPFSRN